ncbi:hypothetical protein [Peterkaempfera bronchialis]|uniref:hypothetical protein n=1 Tax=Peterkaempfera bronchialis TaxID=2126346 RepID=UPI0013B3A628|nr:hypothetical protein [Peterkaempfera bronchialis]
MAQGADEVQAEPTRTQRQTWTLDSNLRFRGFTTETNTGTTWTQTTAKLNHYDTDIDGKCWQA